MRYVRTDTYKIYDDLRCTRAVLLSIDSYWLCANISITRTQHKNASNRHIYKCVPCGLQSVGHSALLRKRQRHCHTNPDETPADIRCSTNGRCALLIKQCLWCIRLPSGASPRIWTPLQSSANMERCSYESCTRRPTFSCKGKKAAYCRQHAPDSMIAVHHSRCSHDACTKQPVYNFEGSKTAVCCCKHAEDGMVDVRSKRCLSDSCYKTPSFNFIGRKSSVLSLIHI